MNKEEYLNEVISLIKSKSAKRAVRKELENHIDDRTAFYLDSGYDEEYAENRAVEKMGSAAETAEKMQKLHNNSLWKALAVIFFILFIAGLVTADVFWTDFAIIIIVDFSEVTVGVCLVSVMTFFSFVMSLMFAGKAKSPPMLMTVGFFGIIYPIVSLNAFLPFGYQLIGLFSDFPAAIISGDYYFQDQEVFLINTLFDMPASLYGIMLILTILAALIPVFMGFYFQIYGSEMRDDTVDVKYEKRADRVMKVLIVTALIAVIGTGAELIYDTVISKAEEKQYLLTYESAVLSTKEEFDAINLPMTKEEILALAKEKGIPDSETEDMEQFYSIDIYKDNALSIDLSDENEDGIYEAKCIYKSWPHPTISKDDLQELPLGSDIYELYKMIDVDWFFAYYSETVNGSDLITEIGFYDDKNNDYYFEYTNSRLTDQIFPDYNSK